MDKMRMHNIRLDFADTGTQAVNHWHIEISMCDHALNRNCGSISLSDKVIHEIISLNKHDEMAINITCAEGFQQNQQMAFCAADLSCFDDVRHAHVQRLLPLGFFDMFFVPLDSAA